MSTGDGEPTGRWTDRDIASLAYLGLVAATLNALAPLLARLEGNTIGPSTSSVRVLAAASFVALGLYFRISLRERLSRIHAFAALAMVGVSTIALLTADWALIDWRAIVRASPLLVIPAVSVALARKGG